MTSRIWNLGWFCILSLCYILFVCITLLSTMKVCYIYNHNTHTQILQHGAAYCPNYCSQHLICLLNPRISLGERFLLYKTDLCKLSFTSCSIFLRPTKRKIKVGHFPGKVYSGFQTLPPLTHLCPLQNPPGPLGPRLGADLKGCGFSGVTGLAGWHQLTGASCAHLFPAHIPGHDVAILKSAMVGICTPW